MRNLLPKNNAGETFTHFDKAAFIGRTILLCLWTAVVMGVAWYCFCRFGFQSWARTTWDSEGRIPAFLAAGAVLFVIFLLEALVGVIATGLEPKPKRLENMHGVNSILIVLLAWAFLSLLLNGQGFFWFCGGMLVVALGTILVAADERRYRCSIIPKWCRDNAFMNRADLIDFAIPDGVTNIGTNAFANCRNLRSIAIPDSVESIGNEAFSNCPKLKRIAIPPSVTRIGIAVFEGDSDLSVSFFRSYKCDLSSPFRGCSKLSVAFMNGVTNIEDQVFSHCSELISITIPNSVKSIGREAFSNCSGLTSITIPNGVKCIGDWAFHDCSGLTSITIPDSVTSIGDSAFWNCYRLTSVTIPDGVTSIDKGAFWGCPLESVVIPNSVTNIGDGAFKHSKLIEIPVTLVQNDRDEGSSLRKICDDDGVFTFPVETGDIGAPSIRIGANVFRDCQITDIPHSVTEVGEYAFMNTRYYFPGLPALEIVKEGAFWQAELPKDNLDLPDSLKEIGQGAFWTYDPPKTVKIGPGTLSWDSTKHSPFTAKDAFVVDTGNATFSARDGVLFSKDGTILVSVPQGRSGDFTVPDGVTAIVPGAFRNCRLLQSVRIPSSVKAIGYRMFQDCHSLVDCEIPTSVETIGVSAFRNCRSLERIRLPQNVSVDSNAFVNCVQLVTVEFDATVKFINERYPHFLKCERLSQETRDRFRAYTGDYPEI